MHPHRHMRWKFRAQLVALFWYFVETCKSGNLVWGSNSWGFAFAGHTRPYSLLTAFCLPWSKQLLLPPTTMAFCLSLGSETTWPRPVDGNLPKQREKKFPLPLSYFSFRYFSHSYIQVYSADGHKVNLVSLAQWQHSVVDTAVFSVLLLHLHCAF